jgi:polar amino acid transport system substrate-binding protein
MTHLSRHLALLALVTALTLVAAACGGGETEEQAGGGETTGATEEDRCAKETLQLVQEGKLTVGTDNPAFPPWFEGGTEEGSQWELNDPSTGEGYESAVTYAVAEQLGFAEDEVEWVVVPFDQSFKPGPKDFDFDINQISFTEERAESVDFSDSYYDVAQALVALNANPVSDASSLEELKEYKLGAPIGTTSYQYIVDNIQPEQDPAVYNTLNDSISGVKGKQIDGVVVDLPTAFFITAVQLPKSTIVGQFPQAEGQEYFGMVFEKGNPLVECVNEALAALREDGTLDQIEQEWLADKADAPVLE